MGVMCHTPKERLRTDEGKGEERKRKEGKRKGERNGGAIDETSLDLRQSNDQNSSE